MDIQTTYKANNKLNFLAILFILFLSGFTYSSYSQQIPEIPEAENENYRIGPGDVIDILINKNSKNETTLSRTGVRVSNEGKIQLVMLGDIQAACLTEKELAEDVREKYKKYLVTPNVIVAVKEFNSTPITVLGAVNSPKQFQLQRPMRLFEVLTLVNGPSNNAGPTVQIIRNPDAHNCRQKNSTDAEISEQMITYELSKTLEGDDQYNPFVQTGDVIRVLQAEEAKQVQAYLIGNVKSAKTIDLKEPVTLTQAIAMAGGTSEGAQTEKIKISRQIPGSLSKTQVIVNLKEINRRNEGDILLQPNDIIDVPGPSGSKKFFRDIIKGIIPAVTRFPIPIL